MDKIDARKLSTDAQQQVRYQVIRLRKQGRTHNEISAITGVHRSTCVAWWNLYKNEGKKALKIKSSAVAFAVVIFFMLILLVTFFPFAFVEISNPLLSTSKRRSILSKKR